MATPQEVLDQIDDQLFVLEDGLRVLTLAAEADGDVDAGERAQLDGIAGDIALVKDKRKRLAAEIDAMKDGGLMGLVAAFNAHSVAAEDLKIGPAERAARALAGAVCSGEKPLTAREEVWIAEVRQDPDIDMLFTLYGRVTEVAEPEVGRVGHLCGDDGAPSATQSGVHYDADAEERAQTGHDIEIADAVYTVRQDWTDDDGTAHKTTDEEEFKFTLIHEMVHHLVDQTEDLPLDGSVITPSTLIKVMLDNPAIFGWYLVPVPDASGAMATGVIRLEDTTVSFTHEGATNHIPKGHRLRGVVEAESYEAACDTRSPEEDVADMLAMFLTCGASRKHLQAQFPKRFDLCLEFYEKL